MNISFTICFPFSYFWLEKVTDLIFFYQVSNTLYLTYYELTHFKRYLTSNYDLLKNKFLLKLKIFQQLVVYLRLFYIFLDNKIYHIMINSKNIQTKYISLIYEK